MFFKCYAAWYWEKKEVLMRGTAVQDRFTEGKVWDGTTGKKICEDTGKEVKPRATGSLGKLSVLPLFAPTAAFSVESADGSWCGDVKARYVQACRHLQGLAETSYLLVQWGRLSTTWSAKGGTGRGSFGGNFCSNTVCSWLQYVVSSMTENLSSFSRGRRI